MGQGTVKDDNAVIAVNASGQNLDRLVSCDRAARRGGRLLVIDRYQAFVLVQLAPLSGSIPQFTWEGVHVSFAPHQVERLKAAGLMDLFYEMGLPGVNVTARLRATSTAARDRPPPAQAGLSLACMHVPLA